MQKIIVIGAGILGASAAYHLAKSGHAVILVDRQDKGQATEAAAGIVCPWLSQRRNQAWYQLVRGGAKYYPELIQQLEYKGETKTGYKRVGAISLHTDLDKLEKIAARAEKKREAAPEMGDVTILNASETNKRFPLLSGNYHSVHVSGGARVNGKELRDALIKAAIKSGTHFLHGDASVTFQSDRITGIKLNGNLINADQVIVTGGVWARELFQPLGIQFSVTPQKAQIIHLELKDYNTGSWPVVMPPNNQYILTFEGGRVVVGSTHEDEAGMDHRVTAGGMNEILSKAIEVAPGLEHATFVEARVGFRPFTPGFLPVIGSMPGVSGLILANGLGASGLTSGPYLGAELAKMATGEKTEIDLSLYKISGAIEL